MRVLVFLSFLAVCCSGHVVRQEEREWWRDTIFYQVYPRSFADSNGDGIGDLNGITSKLGYIKDLGVDAVWLSPMFQSPMYDFGYDIADFYAIHDEYGTMEDFENLIKVANEIDLKIVLDLVPNHTSNESVWFQEALKGNEKYYNYFMWEDGIIDEDGNRQPPNNWLSHYSGSAWEYKEEVGHYYLHQFAVGQPDLNYRNPEVVEEMKNIMRYWLNKGAAGFRVDGVNYLFEVDKDLFGGVYPDAPRSNRTDVGPNDYNYLDHIYSQDMYDTYYMVYEWRDLLDEFTAIDGKPRVMMTEVYSSIENVVRYYGEGELGGAQIPFNFDLIFEVDATSTAADIKRTVDKFLEHKPIDKDANWVVGNHDTSRMATRYTPHLVDGINMLVLLLPGISVTYMGEELGLVDGYVSWEDTVDPFGCTTADPAKYALYSRDPARTPFQWNAEKNAGFSTADKTWLPVAEGYETLNVKAQLAADRSHIKVYQALAKLRLDNVFRLGSFESLAVNDDVFVFRREYNNENCLVLVNMREEEHIIDLTQFENVAGDVSVVLRSIESPKNEGDNFDASSLPVAGYEGLVLKLKN